MSGCYSVGIALKTASTTCHPHFPPVLLPLPTHLDSHLFFPIHSLLPPSMTKKDGIALAGHVSGQANKPMSRPAHALPHQIVTSEVGANPKDGLTTTEAQKRVEEFGCNELGDAEDVAPGKILLRQIANAMTLVMRTTSVVFKKKKRLIQLPGAHPGNGCQLCHSILD